MSNSNSNPELQETLTKNTLNYSVCSLRAVFQLFYSYLCARQTPSRQFDLIVLYAVWELLTATAVTIVFIFITAGF